MMNIPLRIPYKYKIFVVPTLAIFTILLLSFTVGRILIENIFSYKTQLSELKDKNERLVSKTQVLQALNKDELISLTQAASLAVPTQTSSLHSLSTIRSLASGRGIFINDFRILEETSQRSAGVNIQITANGQLQNLIGFLNDLESYAPLTKVVEVNVTSAASSLAKVNLVSVWSPMPKKPDLETPLEPLSDLERNVLSNLQNLKRYATTNTLPASPGSKQNPFEF